MRGRSDTLFATHIHPSIDEVWRGYYTVSTGQRPPEIHMLTERLRTTQRRVASEALSHMTTRA